MNTITVGDVRNLFAFVTSVLGTRNYPQRFTIRFRIHCLDLSKALCEELNIVDGLGLFLLPTIQLGPRACYSFLTMKKWLQEQSPEFSEKNLTCWLNLEKAGLLAKLNAS